MLTSGVTAVEVGWEEGDGKWQVWWRRRPQGQELPDFEFPGGGAGLQRAELPVGPGLVCALLPVALFL